MGSTPDWDRPPVSTIFKAGKLQELWGHWRSQLVSRRKRGRHGSVWQDTGSAGSLWKVATRLWRLTQTAAGCWRCEDWTLQWGSPQWSRTSPGEKPGDLQTSGSWGCDVHTYWRSYHAIEQPVELYDLQIALLVPELALIHSMPDSLSRTALSEPERSLCTTTSRNCIVFLWIFTNTKSLPWASEETLNFWILMKLVIFVFISCVMK